MAYTDPDDSTRLPSATSGALPQAIARKNARRGGTPNAPEVDDEPAPASNNGSGAPVDTGQQQAIAATTPGYGAAVDAIQQTKDAYNRDGIGAAVGQAGRGALATGVGVVNDTVSKIRPAWDIAAQGLKTLVTGDSSPIGAAAAAPPTAAAPVVAAPPAIAAPAVSTLADNPGGQVAPPLPSPSTTPAGVSSSPNPLGPPGSDLNPGAYHQQYLAMQAKDAADAQSRRTANIAQGNQSALTADLSKAEGEARVANFRATNGADMVLRGGNDIQRGAIVGAAQAASGKAAGIRGQLGAADRDLATAGNQDQIGDAARQGATIAAGVGATQAAQQNVLMNPLHVEKLKQDISSGGTAQKIAELTLKGHEREQQMLDDLQNAKTPEEYDQKLNAVLALRGQTKIAVVDQDTGQKDATGNPIFKKVAVNIATGKFLEPSGTMGGPGAPLPNHIDALKAGKVTAEQFDAKYGAGAAKKALGQ